MKRMLNAYPSPSSANLWLLLSHFLQNMTIQKIKLMEHYQIPYISMVDYQYNGIIRSSQKFIILDNKLEYELSAGKGP
jgi:hypothetical protein